MADAAQLWSRCGNITVAYHNLKDCHEHQSVFQCKEFESVKLTHCAEEMDEVPFSPAWESNPRQKIPD